MTTVDQERFAYYVELELARKHLASIPDEELAASHLAKHDELVAAGTPRSDFRELIRAVEPTGTEQLDYAVPLYLDDVYSSQESVEISWNSAFAQATEAMLQAQQLEEMRERALARIQESVPDAAPAATVEDTTWTLQEELEGREFTRRIGELRSAGRIDENTEQQLQGMVAASSSVEELRARMHHTATGLMGDAEFRYLDTTLSTPLGQRPETWAEAETYARAFDTGQSLTPEHMQRMERDRQIEVTRTYG